MQIFFLLKNIITQSAIWNSFTKKVKKERNISFRFLDLNAFIIIIIPLQILQYFFPTNDYTIYTPTHTYICLNIK